MRRVTFSIGGLMVSVGLVAIVLAALRDPSALWASIVFSATLACLAAATVLAVCRQGRARAAWAGVAVFGFAYLHFGIESPPLVTSRLVDAAGEWIIVPRGREICAYSREGRLQGWVDLKVAIENTTRSVPVGSVDLLAYRQIGHSILGLLAGLIGGAFGLMVAPRRAEGSSA